MKLVRLFTALFSALFILLCNGTFAQAPSNNSCYSPVHLNASPSCSPTAGSTTGATQSYASNCGAGNADDDVWYSFEATSTTNTITVSCSATFDAVIELHSGCTATNLACRDVNPAGGTEIMTTSGLTVGETYMVRVYNYGVGSGSGSFSICVTGPAPTPPSNDDPCGAIALGSVTSECSYGVYSTAFATETSTSAAPAPTSCTEATSNTDGGYATESIQDVWFSVVVPSSGELFIQADPNVSSGYIADATMALYTGSACSGTLSQYTCSENHAAYPGSTYDNLPYINATGLTPGTTVYIRYWAWGDYAPGNFGLCVSTASNDACSTALYICDLDTGYHGSTSSAYTIDRPCNMRGDAEVAGTYSYTPGTNQQGVFGQAPSFDSNGGNAAFDVQIDNNSWLRFTANSTAATFTVTVGDCWINKGIQMQVFSASNCCNFAVVSQYKESATGFTLSAQGLTPYQDYYIMVDGFAGDICNYTIQPLTGILLPDITANDSVCVNSSITLYGPSGAASYSWAPGGQTTQNITVTPSSTGQVTYTLTAGGVCNKTQILTKTITVVPLPSMTSSANPAAICSGQTLNVPLTSNPSSTYSWLATNNTNIGGESTSAQSGNTINNTLTSTVGTVQTVVYTVTPRSYFGCVGASQTVTVTVNPTPVLSAVPSQTVCGGSSTSVINFSTNTPSNSTINWTSGGTNIGGSTSGSGVTSIPPFATTTSYSTTQTATYAATVVAPAAVGGCTGNTQSFSITVKPKPVIATVPDTTVCGNTVVPTINFSASPNTAIDWVNNNTATGLTQTSGTGGVLSFTSSNVTSQTISTITLNASLNGCAAGTVTYSIIVNPLPSVATAPTETPAGCGLSNGALTGVVVNGSGPLTYTWTNSSSPPVVVGNSQDLNNQPVGSYNLIVSDDNCTATLGPFSITNPGAPAQPDTSSVSGTTLCEGDALDITASSTETNPTFAWTGPNSNSSSGATITVPSVTTADAGTYTVTITLPNNCASTKTVSVVVSNNPTPNITSSANSYCSGQQIDLFGSGGSTYQWNGPNSFSSNIQNPGIQNSTTSMDGTYTLTVTNAAGCSANTTMSITVNPTPQVPLGIANDSSLCVGDSLQLAANSLGATGYAWSGPSGFTSTNQNPVINPINSANAGAYIVNATIGACTSANDTVMLVVNNNPPITAGVNASPICAGTSIDLQGLGGGTYSWQGPAGSGYSSGNQNPSIANATTTMSGYYVLTVTDNNNCHSVDSVNVLVNPTPADPTVSAGDDSLCVGENLLLNATSTGAGSYSWTGPNGFSSVLQNPFISSVTLSNAGQYTVHATQGSCNSADVNINIVVNANPVAVAGAVATTICSGNSIDLTGSGGGTYLWSGSDSAFSSNNANTTIASATTAMSGTYTLTVTSNNCSDQDVVFVQVNETPAAAITTGGVSCSGGSSAMSATGNGIINWYGDANLTNLVNTGNTYDPGNGSGTYYVTVTDATNGCTSAVATVGYSSYNIDAAFSMSDSTGYVPLTIDFTNNSIGVDQNDSVSWTIDQNVFSNSFNASNVFEDGGNFLIGLYIMDYTSGCVDSAYATVFVNGEISVVIPNIFTPNHDGINDGFELDIKGAKEALGYIYNRWGQLLYEWDALNVTWDGKVSNGQSVPDGIYFYIIRITGYNGKTLDVPGNVTIVK